MIVIVELFFSFRKVFMWYKNKKRLPKKSCMNCYHYESPGVCKLDGLKIVPELKCSKHLRGTNK